ncbi:hypothetical protein NE237_006667 [Protea cynaroides]|uniref:Uncharacterized protein n=1 Tax=Protea cynaroides TaxID=273540 RepID=A0A9Q0KMU0_9MAGN|nr:hypothetical protein NE237_006667 [Protea cynaroides]
MEIGNYYKKGLWTVEEDKILMDYIAVHGKGRWNHIAKVTGLKRSGKSCRLRWMNYLSPDVKKGNFSEEEDDLIIRLHNLLGNRWSLIAGRVPGRTDNQVKNHWNHYLSKKLGIQKKNNRVEVCSVTQSRQCREELKTPASHSEQSLKILGCDSGGNGTIMHQGSEGSQEAIALEPETSECFVGSFWLCDDDLNQDTSTLFELLGGYPLGMDWPDL